MKKLLVLLPALAMLFVFSSAIYTPDAQARNYGKHHGKHFNHPGHRGYSHFNHDHHRHGHRHYKHNRYRHHDYRYRSFHNRRHRHHAGCGHYGHRYKRGGSAYFSIQVPLFDHFYYRH